MENFSTPDPDNDTLTTVLPDTASADQLNAVISFLARYYIWIIFAFGLPGNLISLVVIIRMSRRRLSTPLFYVGLLSVVDNLSIILKVAENQISYNQIPMNKASCKILYFFGLSTVAYANWILIIMSAERFTAVKFPMRVGQLWSLKKSGIIISCVLVFLWLVHFHLFFMITSNDQKCAFYPEYHSFLPWWFMISVGVYAFTPAVILFLFNALIIAVLKKSAVKRQDLISKNDPSFQESRRQERKVTIMLVTVAVVFVLLTSPVCIYHIIRHYWQPDDVLGKARIKLFSVIASCLADSNHAVNFYLYFVAGRKFRKCFVEMIRACLPCLKKSRGETTNTTTQVSELPLDEIGQNRDS